jgi:uncharacterized membrane protein
VWIVRRKSIKLALVIILVKESLGRYEVAGARFVVQMIQYGMEGGR